MGNFRMKVCNTNQLFLAYLRKSLRNTKIFQKFIEHSRCSFIIIFLDRMPYSMEDRQFKFALHLSNCELFIQPFLLSCYQDFRYFYRKEDFRKIFKPTMPKFLCLFQIDFPSILFLSLMLDLDQLGWYRNSSRLNFSQSCGLNTPFDS